MRDGVLGDLESESAGRSAWSFWQSKLVRFHQLVPLLNNCDDPGFPH